MGTGSGTNGLNSRIFTNSYSYQSQREWYNQSIQNKGNSFYGLSIPQYQSTVYYTLSNNGPGAGARCRRFGNPTVDYNIRFGI
jgi:hypothetical protein